MRKVTGFVVLFLLIALCLPMNGAAAKGSKKKMLEITVHGSYNMFTGTPTGTGAPIDLYSGKWSPFFGSGYTSFNWLGMAGNLDSVVGKPILEQKNGPAAGIRIGANLTRTFQIELFFNYVMAPMQFNEQAWSTYNDVATDSYNALHDNGRNPTKIDNSVQSSGKSMQFGLNLNINLMSSGKFIPYISLGAFGSKYSSPPSISYQLSQELAGSKATYKLEIDYTPKMTIGFGGGFGGKLYFNDAMGLKIEVRANLIPFKIEQNIATAFSQTGGFFATYYNYSQVAVVEETNQFVFGGLLGFFYSL